MVEAGGARPKNLLPTDSKRRSWRVVVVGGLVAAAVAAVVVVIAVVASTGSSGPKVTSRHAAAAVAVPGAGAQLAPRDVEIINEQPTTVTIHWVDPNNGRYPFVVQGVGRLGADRHQPHPDRVAGLDPTKGYCFVVGAVYGVGGQIANAAPVCVRGGTM